VRLAAGGAPVAVNCSTKLRTSLYLSINESVEDVTAGRHVYTHRAFSSHLASGTWGSHPTVRTLQLAQCRSATTSIHFALWRNSIYALLNRPWYRGNQISASVQYKYVVWYASHSHDWSVCFRGFCCIWHQSVVSAERTVWRVKRTYVWIRRYVCIFSLTDDGVRILAM
jgi:hypothetical protein